MLCVKRPPIVNRRGRRCDPPLHSQQPQREHRIAGCLAQPNTKLHAAAPWSLCGLLQAQPACSAAAAIRLGGFLHSAGLVRHLGTIAPCDATHQRQHRIAGCLAQPNMKLHAAASMSLCGLLQAQPACSAAVAIPLGGLLHSAGSVRHVGTIATHDATHQRQHVRPAASPRLTRSCTPRRRGRFAGCCKLNQLAVPREIPFWATPCTELARLGTWAPSEHMTRRTSAIARSECGRDRALPRKV